MTFKIPNISGAKELGQTQNIPDYFTAKVEVLSEKRMK